jgi:hypothetical protein
MANANKANVIFVDTTGTAITGLTSIASIKYIGNASGTATIKNANSGGATLWEESGASNVFNQVEIDAPQGLYVTLTNGAKVYIYLECD